MSHLVLGTAQLGLPYGIHNSTGQPSAGLARDIVRTAFDCGIREFDTAQSYGNSEEVLGQALTDLGLAGKVSVVSKLAPTFDTGRPEGVADAVAGSLKRLRVRSLSGFMLHDENHLDLWDRGLGKALNGLVGQGLVRGLGVSVYTPARALAALGREDISFVQLPANVLDHRFQDSGVFVAAARAGKTVYIRSAFLQGLLLKDPAAFPPPMDFARDAVQAVWDAARELGMGARELSLRYVRARWPEARIVFGAELPSQVSENAELLGRKAPAGFLERLERLPRPSDERVVNPVLWPRAR